MVAYLVKNNDRVEILGDPVSRVMPRNQDEATRELLPSIESGNSVSLVALRKHEIRSSTQETSLMLQYDATKAPEDEYAVLAQTLYALCKVNRDREAIAEALDYFDDRLIAGRFRDCDRALQRLQVGKLASSVLVSILGITIRATRERLPSRKSFYERAFQEIARQKGKKYARELLTKYL